MFAKFCAPTQGLDNPFFLCPPADPSVANGEPTAALGVDRWLGLPTGGDKEELVVEFLTVDELLDLRAALDAAIDYLQRNQERVSS